MGKSIEEILQKMQAEKQAKKELERQQEYAINEAREKARQDYLLRNKMYEMAFNPTSAASSAAGAGGGRRPIRVQNTFLAFDAFSYNLYSIDESGNSTNVSQIFNGITVLSDCSDDPNFIYFVTFNPDLDKVIFGKFDKLNYQRIDIDDTNLNNETNSIPNSLYYAGGGNFIYSSDFSGEFPDTQDIWSISIDGQTINLLSTFDESSIMSNIFDYDNQNYAVLFDEPLFASLNFIDLNTGSTELIDYFSMNTETLPDNISSNTKVLYVLDVKIVDNQILGIVIFSDKENALTYACVGKINLEETLIDFVNALPSPSFGEILFTSFVVL
jgi:hypothetical protein